MKIAPLRAADGILAAAVILVAGVWLAVSRLGAQRGAQVAVEAASKTVAVCDLLKDTAFSVSGRDGLTLTVTVQNGRVRVSDSTCPDGLCEHAGWLSRGGQSAVCVPAGITVRVIGGTDAVDGVTS